MFFLLSVKDIDVENKPNVYKLFSFLSGHDFLLNINLGSVKRYSFWNAFLTFRKRLNNFVVEHKPTKRSSNAFLTFRKRLVNSHVVVADLRLPSEVRRLVESRLIKNYWYFIRVFIFISMSILRHFLFQILQKLQTLN